METAVTPGRQNEPRGGMLGPVRAVVGAVGLTGRLFLPSSVIRAFLDGRSVADRAQGSEQLTTLQSLCVERPAALLPSLPGLCWHNSTRTT